jgi:DNA-binding Lrp family transcriptional regulator
MTSQIRRIAKVLRANKRGAGITPDRLAQLAGVPKTSVYKRIHDLRNESGQEIYSNFRTVDGRTVMYYRIYA